MWFSTIFALFLVSAAYAHEGHDHSDHDHAAHGADQKVALAIYYESLCPDSIKFFKNQLTRSFYNTFMKHISVQFVPFGKSTQWYSNGYQFKCHHGENECYGNIVQACAATVYLDEKDRFNFISCAMTSIDNPKNVENSTYPTDKCVKENNLDKNQLENCISDGHSGLEALSKMGNLTKEVKPTITGVPTITVNTVVTKDAEKELKTVICKELKTKNLKECSSGAGTITSSVLLMALASFLRSFIFH